MTQPPGIDQLRSMLVQYAGGYLRNNRSLEGQTCPTCRTPIGPQYHYCWSCQNHVNISLGRADHVAALAYAIEGQQSHYLMRNYKGETPILELRIIVSLLAAVGLRYHLKCLEAIAERPVTHWSTVPSLPAKPGEHPLHVAIRPILRKLPEVHLTAALNPAAPREFRSDHFQATPVPSQSHVLVIEDTWVSGGHAQSAAYAVRKAGASTVSILSLARYLKEDYGNNREFMNKHLSSDFDPMICPWTATGDCPTDPVGA